MRNNFRPRGDSVGNPLVGAYRYIFRDSYTIDYVRLKANSVEL